MDPLLLGSIGLVFVSVCAASAAAVWFLTDPQIARRRLSHVAAAPSVEAQDSLLSENISPAARRVRQYLPKSPREMRRLEKRLAAAGYYGAWPAIAYATIQIALAAGLFFLVFRSLGVQGLLMGAALGAVGYMLPTFWLGRAVEKRKTEISNGLPDAIDLMIVCIESGSGIDQALSRVAEELAVAHPTLAKELETISAEIRAGKPRLEAFKNFAERTKVDDVRSLVAMLVQTDRFGTSIGPALRTHAETSRTKRRQRAEERAAKLGLKLLFPLVFFLFPAFYVVLLGPAVIRIYRELVVGGLGF